MRILILGASGFLGRHLTDHLLRQGHDVEAWSRRPIHARKGLETHTVDLACPASFRHRHGPWDGAVHLAGHAVPGETWTAERVRENVLLTEYGLNHLARVATGIPVVFLSSARVYSERTTPHVEVDPVGPTTLYGLSKEQSESWARFHAKELNVRIVRAFQQLGPGMPSGLLLTDLFDRIANTHGTIAMKGPDSTLDVLDVRDGVDGIARLLATDLTSGSVWNLSSGIPRRVSEIAHALMERVGVERELEFPAGTPCPLVGSSEKLHRATGWTPVRRLGETLDWIVASRGSLAQGRT